jgi:hypothetical protein
MREKGTAMAETDEKEEAREEEKKKGHKVRKFFLFAAIAGLIAGLMRFFRGRKAGFEEDEWQELPPPEGS